MKLLGFTTAAITAVSLIRLHCRPLQMCLNKFYKTFLDLFLPLTLSPEAKTEVKWVINLSMSGSDLAPSFRRYRSPSCVRRIGHIFHGEDGKQQLGCSCPSPYQCEGNHGALDLPAGLFAVYPSPSQVHLVGDRLNNCSSLRFERGWDTLSPSPRSGLGDSTACGAA